MKNYKKLKQLKPDTFKAMPQECELSHEMKKSKGGKSNKLSVSTLSDT
jgi:hypothetical protein